MATNNSYVKFLKGTPAAYEAQVTKDTNTLYFIYETDAAEGTLYLGDKKIGIGDAKDLKLLVDNLSISQDTDGTLYLANYGKSYYQFVPGTNGGQSTYTKVTVSETTPWKEGLEPRVITEDGKLVLGWFEPNTTTVDGLQSDITTMQTAVSRHDSAIADLTSKITTDIPAQIESKINAAIAEKDMLSYVIATVDDSGNIIPEETNPEQYIYLVANEKGNYDEYMYINGAFEKVGDWEVDLSGYVTADNLTSSLAPITATIATHDSSISVLDSALKGLESTVSTHSSSVGNLENGLASLNAVVNTHSTQISSLDNQIKALSPTILSVESRIGVLENQLTWGFLSTNN